MQSPVFVSGDKAVACAGSEQATVTDENNNNNDMQCDQAEQEKQDQTKVWSYHWPRQLNSQHATKMETSR